MLELVVKFMTVLGLGIIELWAAIPAGTVLKLHPLLNGLAAGLGAIIGALLVILIGDRLRNWVLKNRRKSQDHNSQIYRIWQKYGVIGLGLLSPLLTGAPLGAAIGISLGSSQKRLIIWMSIGIVIWTIILTAISTMGFAIIELF